MSNKRSGFRNHLQDIIIEGKAHIEKNGWITLGADAPDVEKIQEILQQYLGTQENPPPLGAKTAASLGPNMGAASEALGNLPSAIAWYRIGRYVWRGGEQFKSSPEGFPHYGSRMTVGMLQMEAAICADRTGESNAAQHLFTWAVKNRSLSETELHEFGKTKQPYAVWEWAIERAYALLCLKEFQSALKAGKEALHWIGKDSRANLGSAAEMPLLIFPTVLALIRYELDPSPENQAEAVQQLDLDSVATRYHPDHLIGLFYLFNLRAKYPELAAPVDDELPPAARAQQGAEACRRWTSKAGIHLDDSLKSLKVMDKHLKELYRNIQDDDQRKLALFMLGSYYGDIVRHELSGGKWNFAADAMLSWSVDWVLGEVELQLWPFQRVHEYATGKTDESLMDLWEETEQAYIEFGLAARLNE